MQDIKKYQVIDRGYNGEELNTSLCIFTIPIKENKDFIQQIIKSNPQTQFWLSIKNMEKSEILLANSIGIKNVIEYPIDELAVNAYLDANNIKIIKNENSEQLLEPLNEIRVMVVDDNTMNIQLIEEVLRGLEINLEVYTQPKNTIEKIKTEKYDLFLLDILMPEISGFDIADTIKNSEINKNTPIMFISALSDYEYKLAGYNSGACCYIEKPYDVSILRHQIYNILKKEDIKKKINKARDTFYAMITHDLKTPITAEITALKLLLEKNFGDLTEEQKEIINDILTSAKFLKSMTDNFLCSYSQKNKEIKLNLNDEDLLETIKTCIKETKYLLSEKSLEIELQTKLKNAPAQIDLIEIKRVITNLIGNASDYAPKGSKIILQLIKSGGEYAFSVTDFGCGITLENPNEIFDENVTFAKEKKRIGFGLGLYISKNIIKAHNGRIFAESVPQKWTRITFTLPILKD